MADIPQQKSLNQELEANESREIPNINAIAAVPISSWKPEEGDGVEADGTMKKRRRCSSIFLEENEKDFSLVELYKKDSIEEIIQDREKEGITLDPEELIKNLKGWKVEKRKRQPSGSSKTDSTYRHPMSKKALRSVIAVRKCVEENSMRT